MSITSVRELGYLSLTMSSLHIIASDLDLGEITAMMDEDKLESYNTIKDLLLYNNMLNYSKSADVK
jgi:hypothetical protein